MSNDVEEKGTMVLVVIDKSTYILFPNYEMVDKEIVKSGDYKIVRKMNTPKRILAKYLYEREGKSNGTIEILNVPVMGYLF